MMLKASSTKSFEFTSQIKVEQWKLTSRSMETDLEHRLGHSATVKYDKVHFYRYAICYVPMEKEYPRIEIFYSSNISKEKGEIQSLKPLFNPESKGNKFEWKKWTKLWEIEMKKMYERRLKEIEKWIIHISIQPVWKRNKRFKWMTKCVRHCKITEIHVRWSEDWVHQSFNAESFGMSDPFSFWLSCGTNVVSSIWAEVDDIASGVTLGLALYTTLNQPDFWKIASISSKDR